MKRTYIKDLKNTSDSEVLLKAKVAVIRDQGKMFFFDFQDLTGTIQGVVFGKPEVAEIAKTLRPEDSLEVRGTVNQRPEKLINQKVRGGDIELEVTGLKVLGAAVALPFDLNDELNLDTHLDNLPLTLRAKRWRDVFSAQATIAEAFRESLREQGFTEFQAPGLVSDDAEGGAGVFSVPYFHNKTAYLATSPQLYKQIMVGVHERVFTICKAFRAEKHATSRHLSEYSSLDFELGFISDHTDVMVVHEQAIRKIVEAITSKHSDVLEAFQTALPLMPDSFPRLKLRRAQALISQATGEDCTSEPDLEPSHERWLCEYAKKELGSDFIYITHYPVQKRPFYTYEDEADPGYTKSFDLLYRGVEITTGGQRIHNYDKLVANIKKWGLEPEKFSYYLQAFKYGLPPHGGAATGLERLTQKFLGAKNVKETTLFPRDINRIDRLLTEVKGDGEEKQPLNN